MARKKAVSIDNKKSTEINSAHDEWTYRVEEEEEEEEEEESEDDEDSDDFDDEDDEDFDDDDDEESDDDDEDDEESDDDEDDEESDDDDDEFEVSIEGETPTPNEDDKKAPAWIRTLRKQHREQVRENRELKAKLADATSTETKPVETLGKKPTLEDDDVDWDRDKYEAKMDKWYEAKRKHDELAEQKQAQKNAETKAWQETLADFEKKKSELKVRDFDEAEFAIQESLSTTQQGMIIQGADNAAIVFYALNKNPKRLKAISEIKDPVKFAFAVAKLETQMKVTNRKASTKPEKTLKGKGKPSDGVDSTLDRLRKEASKTGDFSKVTAYRSKKAKNNPS